MFQKLSVLKRGERVHIRSFSANDILPLHRMYSSLSEGDKKFFRPGFFEFGGPKWLLSNLSLLTATFSTIKRPLVCLWPKTVSPSLVAVNARNELIGFAYLMGSDSSSTIGLCVRGDYQNKGLGSDLLGLTIKLAKKEKIREVCSWIITENIRSIHLFQKFGFKTIHLVKGHSRWKSKDYDCLVMSLHLS